MHVIDIRIHGVLDYVVGLLLIASPYLFGFADGGAAQVVSMVLGVGVIVYSLLTDYAFERAGVMQVEQTHAPR